jgi:hypothetical protein
MSLNVQPVTFFPVPPVRPVTLDRDQAAQKAATETTQAAPPAQRGQTTGRLFDFKV